MSARRLEQLIIFAVALHSVILGAVMLVCPIEFLHLAGWEYEGSTFFPAQSGIFLLILAGAYVAAIWRRPFAWFLVASKASAVLFLLGEYALGNGPATLLATAAFDGLMGAAVATIVTWNIRSQPVEG